MKNGLNLKYITNKDKIMIIFMIVIIQWAVYMLIAYDGSAKIWCPIHNDTLYTLAFARSWVHGHPLQLVPGDPPSTMHSDLLSPLLLTPGYWLGFKSPAAFILWSYIEILIVALISSYFVWRFFLRFLPENAFPATLLSILFTGIFNNLFHTNFGFFFMFFWGALAFLEKFPLFMAFGVLAGLTRPEGLLVYALLAYLYVAIYGTGKLRYLILGIPPMLVPPLIYKILTGAIVPQGVIPQNIIHYEGLFDSIFIASSGITDQVKGTLLGLFPTTTKIGIAGSGWLGTLPPFLFILAVIGLYRKKRQWIFPVMVYLMLTILGDSFTRFSGVHQNRHIHVLSPLFFGYALSSSRELVGKSKSLFYGLILFFGLVIGLQWFGSLSWSRNTVRTIASEKSVAEHLVEKWSDTWILDRLASPLYWADGRLRWNTLSPSDNPYLGRYIKYFRRNLEVSEFIQNRYPDRFIFLSYSNPSVLERWLLQFNVMHLRSFQHDYETFADVNLLDISTIRDSAPYGPPFAEIDIGDPLSEHEHSYKYRDSLERSIGGVLIEGQGFWDGGRASIVAEDFDLAVPPEGGLLVARYKGSFAGNLQELWVDTPVHLLIDDTEISVKANGISVYQDEVRLDEGFCYIHIPIQTGGMTHFRIDGLFNSFHYWIYPWGTTVQDGIESVASGSTNTR